jgi:hypothetical protein
VVDLARFDQFLDRAGDLLDGDGRVHAVLVEQIDRIGPQATQRALDRIADVVRPAGDAGLAAICVQREPELRGDHDVLANRRECFADESLVFERPVDLAIARPKLPKPSIPTLPTL